MVLKAAELTRLLELFSCIISTLLVIIYVFVKCVTISVL